MFKAFFDDILLLNAGRTAQLLYEKEEENKKNQVGNVRSSEIPDIFKNEGSLEDIKNLEKALREKDETVSEWSWISVYLVILKTFKKYYGIYLVLFTINLGVSFYVKIKVKEFFDSFVSENPIRPKLSDLIPGMALILLQTINIIFATHCEYYNFWIHFKIQSAISGSSLSRFLECKRLKNKQSANIQYNLDSTELLSLYQNIILVDSDFTEFAISKSINLILYPLHIITSAIVAHSVFGGTPLFLCISTLLVCFFLSVITQYLSCVFKRPFLEAREERITETTRLLEHSKYLSVTHQLFPSIHRLIQGKRKAELHYNSLRKYICMISEVFDGWMILSCTLAIGLYILFNRIPPTQASLIIIQSVWLIPSFYHPLNDIIFFVYYIFEGVISMDRISKFLYFTRSDSKDSNPKSSSNLSKSVSNIRLHNISFSCTENIPPSVNNVSFTLSPGIPTFILGKLSSGKTALLQGISGFLYNTVESDCSAKKNDGASGYFEIEFSDGETLTVEDISQYASVEHVPQTPWVSNGLPLSDLILCGSEYIEELWLKVMYQCDLQLDFNSWGIKSFQDAKRRIVTDKQFSAGQKVRLSLARAIYSSLSNRAPGPRIILVDCVLNSLDPFVCQAVIERLFSREGLLSGCISIFVIEPPILEFVRRASKQNGFSYRLVHLNDRVVTGTEEVIERFGNTINKSPEIVKPQNFSLDSHGMGPDSYLELQASHKMASIERSTSKSNIDIKKNKFSYYFPVNYFYMFFAGSKKKITYIKGMDYLLSRSSVESFIMIFLLILPSVLTKLVESLLLVISKEGDSFALTWSGTDSGLNIDLNPEIEQNLGKYRTFLLKIPISLGFNVLSFWYNVYNYSLVFSMISKCITLFFEIRIGLRAAKYLHNSLLLGYLGATPNSVLRWLPTSFILNRLSNDQLIIDYCITRRIRHVVNILSSVTISVIPSIFGSSHSLLTLFIMFLVGLLLYLNYIRYFVNGCRILRSCYVSEYSPLVDTIQTIGKGKKCLTNRKIKDFFFETGVSRIDSVLKPQFARICLESWFKMRIKILLTVPLTLMNLLLPYISSKDSSTRAILALGIATITGLTSMLSTLVDYWTKLEIELVSVERSRLYLAASREAGIDYLNATLHPDQEAVKKAKDEELLIELEGAEAKHSRLESYGNSNFDNSRLVGSNIIHTKTLLGISAKFKAGEVIGIIGRTGSGKTTLLDMISGIIPNSGGKLTISGIGGCSESIYHKVINLGFPLDEFEPKILKSTVKFQDNLHHLVSLPLEVYFPKDCSVHDFIDPFREHELESIQAALNICGFGAYIGNCSRFNTYTEEQTTEEKDQPDMNPDLELKLPLLKSNKKLTDFLKTELSQLDFGILQMRMLLFVSFFLKRNQIRILLVDEPPVILQDSSKRITMGLSDEGNCGCILSFVINRYFKHCITFIVSHDIRSLQYVNRVLVLSSGKLVNDSPVDHSFTDSDMLDYVKRSF
ncbi:ABC transporter [Cryptosporidium felis]|nr:ABC transporter [Cryptosporidium felis]